MTDPKRKMLTEEMPESPQDFERRQLTEVNGQIQVAPSPRRYLTEDLPQEEDLQEESPLGRQILTED